MTRREWKDVISHWAVAAASGVSLVGLQRTSTMLIQLVTRLSDNDSVRTLGWLHRLEIHRDAGRDERALRVAEEAFDEILRRGSHIVGLPGTKVPTALPRLLESYVEVCARNGWRYRRVYEPVIEELSSVFGAELPPNFMEPPAAAQVAEACREAWAASKRFMGFWKQTLYMSSRDEGRQVWTPHLESYLAEAPTPFLQAEARDLYPLWPPS